MGKKIILFGSTGLCGVYTALYLKEMGFEVVAVGRREDKNRFFIKNDISYVSLEIKNNNDFYKLPNKDIYGIVNFAGAMPAHMSGYDPYEYINSIVIGQLNVLEFARQNKVERVVFSQSISDVAYAFGTDVPIANDLALKFPLNNDHSVYSISKNTAVYLMQHYQVAYGLKCFALRLPTIYAYHPNKFYYVDGRKKWLGYRLLIEKALDGDPIEVWGDPSNKKELVYVKDFVKIVEGALETDKSNGGIYNVANGFASTFDEQIKTMCEILNPPHNKSQLIYHTEMPSSPQFILDVTKTKEDLNYCPEYDVKKYFIDFKKERDLQRFVEIWGKEDDYV